LGISTAGELQKCSKQEMGFMASFEKKGFVQDFSSKINRLRLPLDAPLAEYQEMMSRWRYSYHKRKT
jgi:hypothetical protein